MIVVEGFDGSGKSTVSRRIAERLGGWTVHHTGGPTTDEDDVRACLDRSRVRLGERCVQDRVTHISESVYSMLTAPKKAAIALDSLHQICGSEVTVVYCRPPTDALLRVIVKHEAKPHETREHVRRVVTTAHSLIAIYDTIIATVERRCQVIRYDRLSLASWLELIRRLEERYP